MKQVQYALVGAPIKWLFPRDARARKSRTNFHFKSCTAVGSAPEKFSQIARKIFQVVNSSVEALASPPAAGLELSSMYLSASNQFSVHRCKQGVTYICVTPKGVSYEASQDFFKAVRKRADYVLKFLQSEQSTSTSTGATRASTDDADDVPVHKQYMQCLLKNLQVTLWRQSNSGSGSTATSPSRAEARAAITPDTRSNAATSLSTSPSPESASRQGLNSERSGNASTGAGPGTKVATTGNGTDTDDDDDQGGVANDFTPLTGTLNVKSSAAVHVGAGSDLELSSSPTRPRKTWSPSKSTPPRGKDKEFIHDAPRASSHGVSGSGVKQPNHNLTASPGGTTRRMQRLEFRTTLPIDTPNLGVLFGMQEPSRPTTRDGRKAFPRMKVILLKRDPPAFEAGALETAGIRVGDVLEKVNAVPIRRFDDLHSALRAAKARAAANVLTRATELMVLVFTVLRRLPETSPTALQLPSRAGQTGSSVSRSMSNSMADRSRGATGLAPMSPPSTASTSTTPPRPSRQLSPPIRRRPSSNMPSWATGPSAGPDTATTTIETTPAVSHANFVPTSAHRRSTDTRKKHPQLMRSASFSASDSPPLVQNLTSNLKVTGTSSSGSPMWLSSRLGSEDGGVGQHHSFPGNSQASTAVSSLPRRPSAAAEFTSKTRIRRSSPSADSAVALQGKSVAAGVVASSSVASDGDSDQGGGGDSVPVEVSSDEDWLNTSKSRSHRSFSDAPPRSSTEVVPRYVNIPSSGDGSQASSLDDDQFTRAGGFVPRNAGNEEGGSGGVGLLIYTFDQGDVASSDMQKDVLSKMDPAGLKSLQAKILNATTSAELQDLVHEFQPILSQIELPPPAAVSLAQAQKDAAREKIVLNGFQYGSVNDLSDALERCVGRLVADGDDARTLANEILRAASRTISGHDSYAACFEIFGVRPDYILVPGDVEAPPILIDTLNHGEGVVKIETVATYELQRRNEETDDLDTWLVLESTITDTLRIFDSAKDRVLCITEGSATPARNAYLVEGASERHMNGRYIRTTTAELQTTLASGTEVLKGWAAPGSPRGRATSAQSTAGAQGSASIFGLPITPRRNSEGTSFFGSIPRSPSQSGFAEMDNNDDDDDDEMTHYDLGSARLHDDSATTWNGHATQKGTGAYGNRRDSRAVRLARVGCTYRNVLTGADLQQFFETQNGKWLPVAFLDPAGTPDTTPSHNSHGSGPSGSGSSGGRSTSPPWSPTSSPFQSPRTNNRKTRRGANDNNDQQGGAGSTSTPVAGGSHETKKRVRCRWALRDVRGTPVYATGSTLVAETDLRHKHQRPPHGGWFALDPITGVRTATVDGKPAVAPTVSVFVMPVHRLVKHKQPAMSKMPDCGVCAGRIWSVKMWSCQVCGAKFHYKPSSNTRGKKRVGKCEAAASNMVCDEAVRRRDESSSAVARMHPTVSLSTLVAQQSALSGRGGAGAGGKKAHSAPNTLNSRDVDFLSSRRISDELGSAPGATGSGSSASAFDDMLTPVPVSGGTAGVAIVSKLDHFDFVDSVDLKSLGFDVEANSKRAKAAAAAAAEAGVKPKASGPKPFSGSAPPNIRRSLKSDPGTGGLAKIAIALEEAGNGNDNFGSGSAPATPSPVSTTETQVNGASDSQPPKKTNVTPVVVRAPPRRPSTFGERFVRAQENFERMIGTPAGLKVLQDEANTRHNGDMDAAKEFFIRKIAEKIKAQQQQESKRRSRRKQKAAATL